MLKKLIQQNGFKALDLVEGVKDLFKKNTFVIEKNIPYYS